MLDTDNNPGQEMVDQILSDFERFLRDKSGKEVANLVAEYVLESNHNSWDGWDEDELPPVAKLFQDIMTYWNNAGPEQFKGDPPFTGTHYAYKKD